MNTLAHCTMSLHGGMSASQFDVAGLRGCFCNVRVSVMEVALEYEQVIIAKGVN